MKPSTEFWVLLGAARVRRDCLATWRHFYGAAFDVIRSCLRPCPGEFGQYYPDPDNGMLREVLAADDDWVAVLESPDCFDECPLRLTEAQVQAYRLDEEALWNRLRQGLHLAGPSSAVEPGLACLGVCDNGPARRRVYLCHASEEAAAMAWVTKAAARSEGAGCLLVPALTDLVERSLNAAGMSGVSLFGNLKPLEPGTPVGACGYACRHLGQRANTIQSLSRQIDEGFRRVAEQATQVPVVAAPRFVFRRAGSHWDVVFDGGDPFHLEDSLGVRYLDHLLHRPNETIAAVDLEAAIRPEKAEARPRTSIQDQADPAAVRAYLRELVRLRAERDDAAETGRHAEAERIEAEIEALESQLPGKQRSTDSGERARDNVRKAIAATLRVLRTGGKAEKAFAAHVDQCVSVGYELLYSQPEGRVWE